MAFREKTVHQHQGIKMCRDKDENFHYIAVSQHPDKQLPFSPMTSTHNVGDIILPDLIFIK